MTGFTHAMYHRDIRTVEYTAANGDRLLRSGGTLAWRLNNPGNLRPSPKYNGVIGTADTPNGRFAIFESPEAGREEKRALLRRRYNELSLRDAIYTYAPPQENDSERYLTVVKNRTGLSEQIRISDMSDEQLAGVMAAMEEMEGYNAQRESRKERWVHVTTITLSDGARPLPGYPVRVVRNGEETLASTDARGNLPALVSGAQTEEVTVLDAEGSNHEIGRILLELRSRTIVLSRLRDIASGAAQPHNPPRVTAPGPAPASVRYIVQPGDTLSTIAQRFRTTVAQLQTVNAATIRHADRIWPGQVLAIGGAPSTVQADPVRAAPLPRETRYVVKRGDTLSSIAGRHGIDTEQLAAANRRSIPNPHVIHPGNTLVIPAAGGPAVAMPAAATQPVAAPRRTTQATAARSRQNEGHPLAIVPLNQRRAPWMEHAYAEARRWAGRTEDVIGASINYHHELGTRWLSSLSGSNNAWCASFVNWCLRQAGYAISKNHFRARSFAGDQNFARIDSPIYGALGMVGTSHVGFVYALAANGNPILLGGNQANQINFTAFGKANMRYYVPLAYLQFARAEEADARLETTTAAALNRSLGIAANARAAGSTR